MRRITYEVCEIIRNPSGARQCVLHILHIINLNLLELNFMKTLGGLHAPFELNWCVLPFDKRSDIIYIYLYLYISRCLTNEFNKFSVRGRSGRK